MTDVPTSASLLDLVEDDHHDGAAATRLPVVGAHFDASRDASQMAAVDAMRRDRALLRSLEAPPVPYDFVARLLGDSADRESEDISVGMDLPRWTASPPIRLRSTSTLRRLVPGFGSPARFALAAGLGAAVTAGLFVMTRSMPPISERFGATGDSGSGADGALIADHIVPGAGAEGVAGDLPGAGDSAGLLATTDLTADSDLHHAHPLPSHRASGRIGARDDSIARGAGIAIAGGGKGDGADDARLAGLRPALSELVLVIESTDGTEAMDLLRRACAEVAGEQSAVALVRNVTYDEAMTSLRQALASAGVDGAELERLARQREGSRRVARAEGSSAGAEGRPARDTDRDLYRALSERLASRAAPSLRPHQQPRLAGSGDAAAPAALGEQLVGDSSAAPSPEIQLELADEGYSHALTIDATRLAAVLERLSRDGGVARVRFAVRTSSTDDVASATRDSWRSWKLASDAAHSANAASSRMIVPIRVESRGR